MIDLLWNFDKKKQQQNNSTKNEMKKNLQMKCWLYQKASELHTEEYV